MDPSYDGDGEEHAELSSDASAGGGSEDRLSALPDDILVLILHRLGGVRAAAQTSVLSRRWRRVWALLPQLNFLSLEPRQIGPVIQAHEAAIERLGVVTRDAGAESVAAWLPVAARRLCGTLFFLNLEREESDNLEGLGQIGAFELPCLERATDVSLNLGFLGLAVPPAGVFARLSRLKLAHVVLYGPGDLGDAVSWPRCPCLQKLTVHDARGLDKLVIHSDSLRQVYLTNLRTLQQLDIVAPALEELKVERCFSSNRNKPVASITATQLADLEWMDSYDPSSVHLGEMRHLQLLRPSSFMVYGPDSFLPYNQSCLSLLRRFKVIECLILALAYEWDIDDYEYMMEDMTMLPDITTLQLNVLANRHAFGASAFHVLRMCSSIKMLMLSFLAPTEVEGSTVVSMGAAVHSVKDLSLTRVKLCLDAAINLLKCFPHLEMLHIKAMSVYMENACYQKDPECIDTLNIRVRKIVLENYQGRHKSHVDFVKFFYQMRENWSQSSYELETLLLTSGFQDNIAYSA